jgi:hypothetical protein
MELFPLTKFKFTHSRERFVGVLRSENCEGRQAQRAMTYGDRNEGSKRKDVRSGAHKYQDVL